MNPETGSVRIDYTNWRDERRTRRILPLRIYWGSNEWHPETQWLLDAEDLELPDRGTRSFAMKDVRSWEPLK